MAEKEIALLENVELRLALTDSDEKFEKTIQAFLPPILKKLGSPHDIVRNKVHFPISLGFFKQKNITLCKYSSNLFSTLPFLFFSY